MQAGGEKQHLLQGMCSLNSQAKGRDREIPWFYRTEAYKTPVTHPRQWEEFSKVKEVFDLEQIFKQGCPCPARSLPSLPHYLLSHLVVAWMFTIYLFCLLLLDV